MPSILKSAWAYGLHPAMLPSLGPHMEGCIRFSRVSRVATLRHRDIIRDMKTSPTLWRLWLSKTAGAAVVHVNSLIAVLNVMKTVRHVLKEAITADLGRLTKRKVHIPSGKRVLSGQICDVVMLWSVHEVRPPSRTPTQHGRLVHARPSVSGN